MSYRSFARAIYGYGLALGFVMAQSTEKCPQRPHRLRIPPPPLASRRMLISSVINLLKHILIISRTPSTTQARHLPP